MNKVLIVDDEKNMREMLRDILRDRRIDAIPCGDGETALEKMAQEPFDACILDLSLPGISGLEVLRRTRDLTTPVPIIMITAYGTIDTAVEAMRLGAFDFIIKPFDVSRIIQTVSKCLEAASLVSKIQWSGPQFEDSRGQTIQIVGQDEKFRHIFDMVQKIARTDAAVLIRGESGTGKELVAQAIHCNGPRKDGPFIAVNCSALPDTLLESEFFCFEKGAFTGAYNVKRGKFELADGGTIFLDEIGDMPPGMQVKLLRVLQERVFMRIGGEKEIRVDVRVIAATNRDLEAAVADGEFREDLYFRLNVATIFLPPLRERRGDIPELARFFVARAAAKNNARPLEVPDDTMARIQSYEWRGNIRELENSIERATILGDPNLIAPSQIPAAGGKREREAASAEPIALPDGILTLDEATAMAQREAIVRALRKTVGNKAEAARLLGISNKTLYNKLSDLDIKLSVDVR
ncbi:MAG: sigma-54 dependent transcriptional regulator [Candidatus Sumerlaeota bacterium]|nr:sigma-54 dependent transcriptional regulator [Candidatus Sumerlaeota bacterium]